MTKNLPFVVFLCLVAGCAVADEPLRAETAASAAQNGATAPCSAQDAAAPECSASANSGSGTARTAIDIAREKYPDADAVVTSRVSDIEYNEDGTYTETDDCSILVLTEKGRREESQVTTHYNARSSKSEILSVTVTRADGTVHEVEVPATLADVTDNSSASSNIYDPMDRRLTCSVPGLKIGDTIRTRIRRTTHASRIGDNFADYSVLEWSSPIVRCEIRVTAPASKPLKNMVIRNPLGNVVHTEETLADGRVKYVWVAENSQQAFPEPEMPPLFSQVQSLLISTFEDWPSISKWCWNLSVPHLEKTNPAITNMVEELTGGAKSRMAVAEKMERLFKFVSQQIRYMGLTMEDTSPGYSPHDVCITFDNRYGVCRDKAALLVAMMRIAGIEAYPTLIHGGAKMDKDVPVPFFNHEIVAVYLPDDPRATKEGYVLMDPTDEASRDLFPAYLSNRSYLVARPDGENLLTTPVPGAEQNAMRINTSAVLAEDGSMTFESDIKFLGMNDNVFRKSLLRRKPADRGKFFERVAKAAAPGAELLKVEILPEDLQNTYEPLSVKLFGRVPEALIKGATRDEFDPPLLSRSLNMVNWLLEGNTALEKRRYPLDLESTALIEEVLKVKNEGAEKFALPDDVEIKGPYEFALAYFKTGGAIEIKRRIAVDTVQVSAEEYLDLRECIKRAEAASRRRPFKMKDGSEGANVRFISRDADYTVLSPYSWVVTNTVVKEILTYDGKKKRSELKFNYNPAWKQVELVEAAVSNRNGKVSKVSAVEMNEFDSDWVENAPRYPASKQLIVNLPSVEIGSVISYKTVTTIKDSPEPFYAVWFFDTFEPTDKLTIRYRDFTGAKWERELQPRLLANEQMTPPDVLWRDAKTVSHGTFKDAAAALLPLATVEPCALPKGEKVPPDIKSIRDWMAKHIRISGPTLYEVKFADQTTKPETVLADHYATRADYIRTLCALLKGAGYEADIVFATLDSKEDPLMAVRDLEKYPRVGMFTFPLCRVREKEPGAFSCFGGKSKELFLGAENEYTPIGASSYEGSHFLDPATGEIGVVTDMSDDFKPRTEISTKIAIRENGAVDVDMNKTFYGAGVGAFRKKYVEMLPEDRSRHHQELIGAISQAASATSDLVTDTDSYPATLAFSCYVPDFAIVDDDAITISVPGIRELLFSMAGNVRENPIGVEGDDESTKTVAITFPKGYDIVEHLPSGYTFANPTLPDMVWHDFSVSTATDAEGRLVVTLKSTHPRQRDSHITSEYFALLKDWSRIAASRANNTIVIRRK